MAASESNQAAPQEHDIRPATAGLLRGVLVLTFICLGSGLGVGLLFRAMQDDIEDNSRKAFLATLEVVLPEASSEQTVGDYPADVPLERRVFRSDTADGVLYAGMGAAQGYSSEIKVLASVRALESGRPLGDDPVIHRMAVVSSQETPGLGENINLVEKDVSVWGAVAGQKSTPGRPWFQEQFSGKRLSDLMVETTRDTDRIAAITGATISSEAGTQATRRAVQRIIERTREVYGQ